MQEDEKEIQEFFARGQDQYEYATQREGIFPKKKPLTQNLFDSEEGFKDD